MPLPPPDTDDPMDPGDDDEGAVSTIPGGHTSVEDALNDKAARERDERKLPPNIAIMEPILRFLQLLCENHNRDLQVSG